jgi:ATP-dependent Clp protease ATP-binding subunit ClpX
VQGTTIGFNSEVKKKNTELMLDKTTPDDLVKFGLIPEFIGRFPSWVSLNELTKSDLIHILQDVKHSYISQYHWLFEQDHVELDFTSDSLELIAERTIANRTGARGLHSELERILMPHMFYLAEYRRQGLSKVVIDVDQVNQPQAVNQ